jgi:hypothetical protein
VGEPVGVVVEERVGTFGTADERPRKRDVLYDVVSVGVVDSLKICDEGQ